MMGRHPSHTSHDVGMDEGRTTAEENHQMVGLDGSTSVEREASGLRTSENKCRTSGRLNHHGKDRKNRRRSTSCSGTPEVSTSRPTTSSTGHHDTSRSDSSRDSSIEMNNRRSPPRKEGLQRQPQRSVSLSESSRTTIERQNSWWNWTGAADRGEGSFDCVEASCSSGTGFSDRLDVRRPLTKEEQEKCDARNFLHVSPLPSILTTAESIPYDESQQREPSLLPTPVQSTRRRASSFNYGSDLWKDVFRLIGPGWLVAMAYVDPGNLEGDLSAGALRSSSDPHIGYRLLWVLLWSTLMGFGLQRLAIKLGTATGKDLATVCRMEFPHWMSVIIWIFTELCLIGADVQAVIGSAIGLKLILGVPLWIGIIVTLLDTFLVLLIDTCGTRKLEACFAFLISLMACCFFANMITSKPDVSAIFNGLGVISIPEGSLPFAVALMGSVIMPHNMFLQSAVVQSRSIDRSSKQQVARVSNVYIIETFCLLFVSLLINIAVVVAFANPKVSSNDGSPLDLYNAHIALESAIGSHSQWIWGLGLLAAGQCSTMACTYAGQFVMEGLLGLRIEKLWLRVIVTRITSILPLLSMVYWDKGTVELIANFVNVMQAFNLPFTLVLLLKFTSSSEVMGAFTLSSCSKFLAFLSGCFLVTANVNLVISQLGGSYLVLLVLLIYFAMLGYLWVRPIKHQYDVRRRASTFSDLINNGIDSRQLIPHDQPGNSDQHQYQQT